MFKVFNIPKSAYDEPGSKKQILINLYEIASIQSDVLYPNELKVIFKTAKTALIIGNFEELAIELQKLGKSIYS